LFPEPDLAPYNLSDEFVENVRKRLPELPDARKARLMETFALPSADADFLVDETERADFFEAVMDIAKTDQAKTVANIMVNDLAAELNANNLSLTSSPVTPEHVAQLAGLLTAETISSKQMKVIVPEMVSTGDMPEAIVTAKGLAQSNDTGAIEAFVDKVIADNPDKVAAYRGGKTGLMGFFVGQVMRDPELRNSNPKVVNQIISDKLNG
jgi:aspartyl-tRNA(Asn)/glutamyl-tRNA(Gln) amidotransferase subunit B